MPTRQLGWIAWTDAFAAIEGNGARASVGFVSPTTWAALAKVQGEQRQRQAVLGDPATGPTGATARSIGGVPVMVTPA